MGYALAEAAIKAGAEVTLISGPVNLALPANCNLLNVETALQMLDAVMTHVAGNDIFIGAAAVADYRPALVQTAKIKKQQSETSISLTRNPDIIASVAALEHKPFVVGFAAETDDLENYATGKLREKNLDMIAANWVGRAEGGFDSDSNALDVYWPGGHQHFAMTDKQALAEQLLTLIAENMHEKNSAQAS
jgi:phosphopantothenoylcysteine decarboxylase/phosphopantothenate--cysteine ligase